MGGGAPPILTDGGWLTLWHGVEPKEIVGIYRTYWSLLDRGQSCASSYARKRHAAARSQIPGPGAARRRHQMYVRDVVFTTGIADGDEGGAHQVTISSPGEADLACRIAHVPKAFSQTEAAASSTLVNAFTAQTRELRASSAASGGKRGR